MLHSEAALHDYLTAEATVGTCLLNGAKCRSEKKLVAFVFRKVTHKPDVHHQCFG